MILVGKRSVDYYVEFLRPRWLKAQDRWPFLRLEETKAGSFPL